MAKGLGQLMGFSLPDNFNYPYLSLSMTEFWRRWHMTLGGWFRDYIYIPLGGSRCGKAATIRHNLVVWVENGLRDRGTWYFIIWGRLSLQRKLIEKMGLKHLLDGCPLIGHLYMMMVIPLTWLSFAVTDLVQMKIYFLRLFPFLAPEKQSLYFAGDFLKYGRIYALSLTLSLIFMTQLPRKLYKQWKRSFLTAVILLAVFWLCVYLMKMGADDPFLYFRF